MISNNLYIGQINSKDLIKQFGTPLYVYDLDKLKLNFRKINESILYENKAIHYAIMANDRAPILRTLFNEGCSLQINSVKEYEIAINSGFSPNKISLTTTNLSKEDLSFFLDRSIQINFDSLEEIEKYGILSEKNIGSNKNIGIRLFMHEDRLGECVTNKPLKKIRVGIKKKQFDTLKDLANKYGLKINGLHGYLASNILELDTFKLIASYISECAEKFNQIDYLNFGGGFGINAFPEDKNFNWPEYGIMVTDLMKVIEKKTNKNICLKIEPGRALVGNIGTLLASVTNIKYFEDWTAIGVNTGFGNFARPIIYNWEKGGYHPMVIANKMDQINCEVYTIFGNSVLQNDILGEDRLLPKTEEGDIIAIQNTGAYGAVMSSDFPGRTSAGEIAVNKNKIIVIRHTKKKKDYKLNRIELN